MQLSLALLVCLAAASLLGCAAAPADRPTAPRLFRVILPVGDIDQAAAFYAAVLGIPGQRVSGGRHYFDCGGTILACFDPAGDGDSHAPAPNPEWLYFEVADLDAVLAACRRAGAVLAGGPPHEPPFGEIATRPWGERSFYAQDPFGNKICFVQSGTLFTGR